MINLSGLISFKKKSFSRSHQTINSSSWVRSHSRIQWTIDHLDLIDALHCQPWELRVHRGSDILPCPEDKVLLRSSTFYYLSAPSMVAPEPWGMCIHMCTHMCMCVCTRVCVCTHACAVVSHGNIKSEENMCKVRDTG